MTLSALAVALARGAQFDVTTNNTGNERLIAVEAFELWADAWTVSDWYIDAVTGSDTNNGTTVATPLKTGAELARRLGPYALWPQSVTVNVGAGGMTDGLVLRGEMMVAGTHVAVIGTPTTITTDTVSAFAALNHATPVASQLTGTLIADWTAYTWRRVRVTAGARSGTVCWVAKANPAGAGLNVARVSVPVAIDTASVIALFTSAVTLLPGDPFVVESLPVVPAITVLVDGPIDETPGSQWAKTQVRIVDVDCDTLKVDASGDAHYLRVALFGLRLEAVSCAYRGTSTSRNYVTGSEWHCSDTNATANTLSPFVSVQYCLFGEGPTLVFNVAGQYRANQVLCQGAAFSVTGGNMSIAMGIQIFDVPGASSVGFQAQYGQYSNISGSGNAGFGVSLGNGSFLRFLGTINVKGAVSDGRLSSAPATNLTLTQLLQPDDYAQKGITPAMVAGSTTVTVPYYDNTTQQVVATHAAVAGTPGILSITQTSTTQFTITSSSNLDTSTVRWQISPAGRNVFLSTV